MHSLVKDRLLKVWMGCCVKRTVGALLVLLSLYSTVNQARSEEIDNFSRHPDLEEFISEMVAKHSFDNATLHDVFRQVNFKPNIIKAMQRPAETKPWAAYRDMFVNPARIAGGVKFWNDNAGTLELAHKIYGVPESLIVAIIGVETQYGRNMGSYRVLDALSTLAFEYPRRAEYFRGELENFLLMTREENTDPFNFKGSYAGAMGIGQFMPGSFRRFAVDFDGDGRRDICRNVTDGIGSVANYFVLHGWAPGQPVAVRAQVNGEKYLELVNMGFNLTHTVNELAAYGVAPVKPIAGNQRVMLIRLDSGGEPEYWLGLNNFQVITQYNRSKYYAMAVYQLSLEIQAAHN